jgi:hypothetical protein
MKIVTEKMLDRQPFISKKNPREERAFHIYFVSLFPKLLVGQASGAAFSLLGDAFLC